MCFVLSPLAVTSRHAFSMRVPGTNIHQKWKELQNILDSGTIIYSNILAHFDTIILQTFVFIYALNVCEYIAWWSCTEQCELEYVNTILNKIKNKKYCPNYIIVLLKYWYIYFTTLFCLIWSGPIKNKSSYFNELIPPKLIHFHTMVRWCVY